MTQFDTIIEKGGGHLAAGGLTVRSNRLDEWRTAVQEYYMSLNLKNHKKHLVPKSDIALTDFSDVDLELLDDIVQMEPFGHSNESPIFEFLDVLILSRRTMGSDNQHVKYVFADTNGVKFTTVAFNAADKFTFESVDVNDKPQHVRILVELMKNEWNGRVAVEGRLLALEAI